MANNLLDINMITMSAMDLFVNDNPFLKNIPKNLASYFGKPDAMIGTTLNIRKRLDYTLRVGQTAQPQSTNEQEVTLTINTQLGSDVYFSSQDLALSLQSFSENVLRTVINVVAGGAAAAIIGMVETGVANLQLGGSQVNTGGIPYMVNYTANGINNPTGTTAHPNVLSVLDMGAYLTSLSCPKENRCLILHPRTEASLVANYAGYFNPQIKLSKQWETGLVGLDTLGFSKTLSDQTVIAHQVANYGTLPTTNGVAQSGSVITVNALTAPLNVGDIISFGVAGNGVNYVNRVTKADTGLLGQFVLTSAGTIGATTLNVYPPVIGPAANGAQVQYQTVTSDIANATQLTSPIQANTLYYKNFGFHPHAVDAVFVKLPENLPGAEVKSADLDGAAIRVARYWNGSSDQTAWRFDTLFGAVVKRPEWLVVLTDSVA
jgi:hypothetical protein